MSSTLPVAKVIRNRRDSGLKSLVFPNDLTTHGMLFIFSEYSYSAVKSNSSGSMHSKFRKSIALPLPNAIEENFAARINGAEMGLASQIAAEAAGMTQQGLGVGQMLSKLSSIAGTAGTAAAEMTYNMIANGNMTSESQDALRYLLRITTDEVAPRIGRALDVGSGMIVNPKQALAYDGPELRTHSWSWKLNPRSKTESDTLRDIRRAFQAEMLPESSDIGGLPGEAGRKTMLKYPSVVEVTFMGMSDKNDWPIFKKMMIRNVNASFTPDNGPSVLAGGRPASLLLQVDLMETETWTRNDYMEATKV